MPRLARNIVYIPGIGGHLLVKRSPGAFEPLSADIAKTYEGGLYLEVGNWLVRHEYVLAKITHSGSNGAIKRVIVAQDWDFACEIPWNAREVGQRPQEAIGFVQSILIGNVTDNYNVSILFQLGDALAYPDTSAVAGGGLGVDRRASLHGPEVLLETAQTICSSTGEPNTPGRIIQVNVRGRGNSLLQGYRGADIQFNDTFDVAEQPPPKGAEV